MSNGMPKESSDKFKPDEDYDDTPPPLTAKDIVDLLNRRKDWLREGATNTELIRQVRLAKSDELAHILDRVTAHEQGIRPITDD